MFRQLLPISILIGIIFALYLQQPRCKSQLQQPQETQEPQPQEPQSIEQKERQEDQEKHNKNVINQLDEHIQKSKIANYSQQSISLGTVQLMDITDDLP